MASGSGPVEKLRSTLASYGGHLRHGAAWRQWTEIRSAHAWLDALFVGAAWESWRIQARWPLRTIGGPRFSRQYGRLIRHAGDGALVFCRVGRFVEFYGPQRQIATTALRLLRATIARAGHAFSVGFPVTLQGAYLSRAVRAGYTVADVREEGRTNPRCAERRVVTVYVPVSQVNRHSEPWAGGHSE